MTTTITTGITSQPTSIAVDAAGYVYIGVASPDYKVLRTTTSFLPVIVNTKVYLQGAYRTVSSNMTNELNSNSELSSHALSQPYNNT